MKLIHFLACLVTAHAAVLEDCVSFNGSYFKNEVLLANISRPYLLAADQYTGNVYFSRSLNSNHTVFQSMRFNLYAHASQDIEIPNGYSYAADRNNKAGNVYIGGWTGIYELSPPNYEPKQIVALGYNWAVDMFYTVSKYLLFSTYPEGQTYIYKSGEIRKLHQFENSSVIHFVFDNNEKAVFINNTGLYGMTKDGNSSLYKTGDVNVIRDVALDNNGVVYGCLSDGIYVIDTENKSLNKLYDIDDAFSVTFDRDNNMIYSSVDSLIRLVAVDKTECK